ncbi:MAG: M20 family metallopeptidase [Coprothermobacterota bacterium]|nr:M20 family metallopeptidase [Coprothermobacterota bacterium]
MTVEPWERVVQNITAAEILALAKELIAIPSHSQTRGQERNVAEAIRCFFQKEGISSWLELPRGSRPNVFARLGEGHGPTLLWCGHTDTVPPGEYEGDPFRGEEKEGCLFGRGAVDMKSSLACAMVALAGLKRAGISLSGEVLFAGVTDEEGGNAGARALLRSGLRVDGAVVGEPTGLTPCLGHRGLEWFQIEFRGVPVHGGRQQEGVNAISLAGRFLHRLESDLLNVLAERRHPWLGPSTLNFGRIEGGTQPSTVAGRCLLQLDRRWIPGESRESVLTELQGLLDRLEKEDPSFRVTLRIMESSRMEEGMVHEAFWMDPGQPLACCAQESGTRVLGKEKAFGAFPAWSDGGLLAAYGGIPTVILGPGKLSSAHSPTESIDISQLLPASLIFADLFMHFCGEERG